MQSAAAPSLAFFFSLKNDDYPLHVHVTFLFIISLPSLQAT